MRKKFCRHATFSRHISIVVCIAQLSACFAPQGVPEARFRRAHELVDVGTRFLRERNFSEARQAFELASELAPTAAAVDGLGCVALLEGSYEVAERYFWEAYEMDRSYDEALVNIGLVKELRGQQGEARAIYLKYLGKNPLSAVARNNVAALEYDTGMGTMWTVDALEKAIVLSDQVVIRDNLAVLATK
jgi:tetratricopeptide (TPR) repeat protein